MGHLLAGHGFGKAGGLKVGNQAPWKGGVAVGMGDGIGKALSPEAQDGAAALLVEKGWWSLMRGCGGGVAVCHLPVGDCLLLLPLPLLLLPWVGLLVFATGLKVVGGDLAAIHKGESEAVDHGGAEFLHEVEGKGGAAIAGCVEEAELGFEPGSSDGGHAFGCQQGVEEGEEGIEGVAGRSAGAAVEGELVADGGNQKEGQVTEEGTGGNALVSPEGIEGFGAVEGVDLAGDDADCGGQFPALVFGGLFPACGALKDETGIFQFPEEELGGEVAGKASFGVDLAFPLESPRRQCPVSRGSGVLSIRLVLPEHIPPSGNPCDLNAEFTGQTKGGPGDLGVGQKDNASDFMAGGMEDLPPIDGDGKQPVTNG